MKINIKKWELVVLYVTIFLILTSIVIYIFIMNMSNKTVRLYYPDTEYSKLFFEKRLIKMRGKDSLGFEAKLIREYMTGPIQFNLVLPLAEDINIDNIWLIPDKSLVLNMNNDFTLKLLKENEKIRWFIQGLTETLKADTKIKRLYLMAGNKNIKGMAGHWNLSYPIVLINENKKDRKK